LYCSLVGHFRRNPFPFGPFLPSSYWESPPLDGGVGCLAIFFLPIVFLFPESFPFPNAFLPPPLLLSMMSLFLHSFGNPFPQILFESNRSGFPFRTDHFLFKLPLDSPFLFPPHFSPLDSPRLSSLMFSLLSS